MNRLQFPVSRKRASILATDDWQLATDSGFTLLEIIVAMVVLGFVVAGLSQATRFGIHAWTLETRLADRAGEMERTERVLRNLFQEAAAPMAADDKPFAGEAHRVAFITRMPDQPAVSTTRRCEVALGIDDHHRLVLRWRPHPNAVALFPAAPPTEIVLAENMDHLDFTYRQSAGDGGKWLSNWTDSNLPALVQVQIVPQKGQRHWPVLLVPTMIDTNGSF